MLIGIVIGNKSEPVGFEIRDILSFLDLKLNDMNEDVFLGMVSFRTDKFYDSPDTKFQHWVTLHNTSRDADFRGSLGENQTGVPRILLSYSILPYDKVEHKKIQKTEQSMFEEGDQDSRGYPTGGLMPGNVYTKGNLRVALERKRVDQSKYRGLKGREETVAILSEVHHGDIEKHMEMVTNDLIDEVNREKQALNEDEERNFKRLKELEKNQGNLAEDELDLKRICERATQSLETTKKELLKVKDEENDERKKLMEQIKQLESELDQVDTDLQDAEHEYEEISHTIRKTKIIPEKRHGEDERLESLRAEADQLLNEIANAVRSGQVAPDFEIYRDENFLENIDHDTQKLLEKERERYNVELDVIELENKCRNDNYMLEEKDHALGIKDANITYQKNHLEALKNELSRANKYYDQILSDVQSKIEEETRDIKDLEKDLKLKKEERERLRKKTESLRVDMNNTSMDFDEESERDIDEQIKKKLRQIEEAEVKRKSAQQELDKIYADWSARLTQHVNNAYANSINARDQEQLDEIKQLIKDNDDVARSVNELLETFDFDIQGMTENLQRLRDEDQLILDELRRAEEAIQAKQHTIKYLDERVLSLTQQLDSIRSEADERRAHIEQLKAQVEAARAEIEAAGGEDPETDELKRQLAAKQAEVRDLEQQVKAKEALYDEWREKVGIKQKVTNRRSKSRKREYIPDPTDEVDIMISEYINNHENPVPIQKLSTRYSSPLFLPLA